MQLNTYIIHQMKDMLIHTSWWLEHTVYRSSLYSASGNLYDTSSRLVWASCLIYYTCFYYVHAHIHLYVSTLPFRVKHVHNTLYIHAGLQCIKCPGLPHAHMHIDACACTLLRTHISICPRAMYTHSWNQHKQQGHRHSTCNLVTSELNYKSMPILQAPANDVETLRS